jgi:hypothetical protein
MQRRRHAISAPSLPLRHVSPRCWPAAELKLPGRLQSSNGACLYETQGPTQYVQYAHFIAHRLRRLLVGWCHTPCTPTLTSLPRMGLTAATGRKRPTAEANCRYVSPKYYETGYGGPCVYQRVYMPVHHVHAVLRFRVCAWPLAVYRYVHLPHDQRISVVVAVGLMGLLRMSCM